MNMTRLDLNLLRVLDAMLQERSVTRAAVKLGLSQPATSNALARLRRELKDPLFVRGSAEMTPTPRAAAMQAQVSTALRYLREAVEAPGPFDARTSTRTFTLAASDHAQLLFMPHLAKVLAGCPGLRLRVVPLPPVFPSGGLEAGELDLVVGVFDLAPGDRLPRGLKAQLLVRERFVAVARSKHPALARSPSPQDVETVRQFHVAPRGGTTALMEGRPGRERLSRNIVVMAPNYLVAPWILTLTDLVAALPERIAARLIESFDLRAVPLDLPIESLKVQQVWHPRFHQEPAHRWLRQSVLDATRASPVVPR